MRVCIAISTIDKTAGGPSRSVPLLAKGLKKCGVDVTLLTKQTPNMNVDILENSGVNIKILKPTVSYVDLKKYIEKEKFDIIHSQNLWEPFYHYIARIARKYSIPYLMTPRGTLEPWSLAQKKLKKKLALAIYQRSDLNKAACVLATADMEAASIRRIGVTAPIAVIPNGIDISAYECRSIGNRDRVKKQILFLSRIHKKKGIEILIEAWIKLNSTYPDWQIIIAGNGEQEYIAELNNRIHDAGLDKSMKIIKPVFGKDKIQLYQESALFILPSYSENFGMVIAEAMSCGVPVITTTGTPWTILNDKKLGWCINLSKEMLIDTISEAIDSGLSALFEKGQMASKLIADTLHFPQVGMRMKQVYEWVLTTQQMPDCVHK